MTKPTWMSEAVYRALRTAFQTFVGVFIIALYSVLIAYVKTPHVFDFDQLYYGGVITGIGAVLALYMNRPKA